MNQSKAKYQIVKTYTQSNRVAITIKIIKIG